MASGLLSTAGVRVPLQSVHLDILAVHAVVEYRMMQTYVNTGVISLQTKYLFPLLDTVGVVGFSATFANGEKVQAVIKERNEAKQIYKDAIQSGTQAALLEEYRPDIFQISVGNLEPGQTVVIDLQYCCELTIEEGKFRLTIPSHVAPRYTPQQGSGLQDDTFCVALCSETTDRAVFSADVCWETSGGSIDTIGSPTHPAFVTRISNDPARANVKLEGGILETDLVLTMKPVDLFQPVVMWEESEVLGRTTQALMLSFVPKFELPMIQNPEVVFVVDCSGSMRGGRMAQAKSALQICLQSLPLGSHFNIVNFGSQFTAMSLAGSVAYNDETLRHGLQYVGSLDACMGGTELIQPLRFCLQLCSNSGNSAKQVILLTDGKVTNEQSVIDSVRGKGSRIFPLGIGSGVSTFLMNGLARATQGHCSFVQDGEQLGPICDSIFRKALTPAISDLKISWPSLVDDDFVVIEDVANDLARDRCLNAWADVGDSDAKEALSMFNPSQKDPKAYRPCAKLVDSIFGFAQIQQAPTRPPPVFANNHFCAFALYPGSADPKGEIEIMGKTALGQIRLKLSIPCLPVKRTEPLLHRMAARALIRDIEEGDDVHFAGFSEDAKRLSLRFSVLCRNTAFVAIDTHNSDEKASIPVASRDAPSRTLSLDTRVISHSKQQQQPTTNPRVFNHFNPNHSRMRPPMAVTNAVSWRSEGVLHKRNEVFVDFSEKLTYLIGADGSVLRSVVSGSVQLKSFLSGMPELKLGFNNKLFTKRCGVENVQFHQCARFQSNDAVISFLPPDGEFQLMSYEYSDFAKPPVRVETVVTQGLEQNEYHISLKSVLRGASRIVDFEAHIPFPSYEESPQINASVGLAKYCPKKRTLTWQAKLLETHRDISLTIVFSSSRQRQIDWHTGGDLPTIDLQYEIPQRLASNIQARFLKVIEKSGYGHTQHIRYHTIAEKCQHRLPF